MVYVTYVNFPTVGQKRKGISYFCCTKGMLILARRIKVAVTACVVFSLKQSTHLLNSKRKEKFNALSQETVATHTVVDYDQVSWCKVCCVGIMHKHSCIPKFMNY